MTRVRLITPAIVVLAVAAALAWWSMPAAAQMPVEVPDVLGEEEDESSEEQPSESEPTEGTADAAPTEPAAELAPDPAPDPAPAPEPPPPEPQEPAPGDQQAGEQRPAPVSGMASGPRLQSRPMPDGPAPADGPDEPVLAPQVAGPEANAPGVSVAPPEEEEPAAAEPGTDEPETTESMDKISVASGGPSGGASDDGQRQAMPTLAVLMALAVGLAWNDRRQRRRVRQL